MNFSELAKKWPSAIVARSQVNKFSGGLLNSRTLANLDSLGQGPPRGRMGRKVFYPVDGLITWMNEKVKREI
ncbi:MAG: hypothetical protein A2X93_04935 [Deltaproteobacteria bacterium GWC2_56_8]|nr:MAG: hypothetical protein A2X93_04935 [Deltaproteobacteria bacterium GWC2_56_8]HAO92753.1 hypothetical protein [Deltaproteobacteria bacterium]